MRYTLVLVLLLFVVPTRADSIDINASAYFEDITVINGLPYLGPVIETFQTSFIYDTVSQEVSGLSFSATGLLGKHFEFTGIEPIPPAPAIYGLGLVFSNRNAIIETSLPSVNFPTAQFPENEIGGTKPLLLQCLTDRCQDDFGSNVVPLYDNIGRASGTFLGPSPSTSPVPEPSSLSLLGVGLIAAGLLMRKNNIAKKWGSSNSARRT